MALYIHIVKTNAIQSINIRQYCFFHFKQSYLAYNSLPIIYIFTDKSTAIYIEVNTCCKI